MEKLLTMEEAAELLSITKGQLYKLTHKKQISVVKVGKHNRFDEKSIQKYIKDHTISAKPVGY